MPENARTFVLGDCHGYPELIINVVRDIRSRYGRVRPGVDRLVFVGDFLDRGPFEGARQCLDLIEALADEVLWGNHDLAAAVGYEIKAQHPSSERFRDTLRERLARGSAGGGPEWMLATTASGVLITHAGVSDEYEADLAACRGDLDEFVRRLNEEFAEAAEREIRTGDWKTARIRNKTSPSHYKLEKNGIEGLLDGVVQVIGHTPPEKLARGHKVVQSVELAPHEVGGAALASQSPLPRGPQRAVDAPGARGLACGALRRYAAARALPLRGDLRWAHRRPRERSCSGRSHLAGVTLGSRR